MRRGARRRDASLLSPRRSSATSRPGSECAFPHERYIARAFNASRRAQSRVVGHGAGRSRAEDENGRGALGAHSGPSKTTHTIEAVPVKRPGATRTERPVDGSGSEAGGDGAGRGPRPRAGRRAAGRGGDTLGPRRSLPPPRSLRSQSGTPPARSHAGDIRSGCFRGIRLRMPFMFTSPQGSERGRRTALRRPNRAWLFAKARTLEAHLDRWLTVGQRKRGCRSTPYFHR